MTGESVKEILERYERDLIERYASCPVRNQDATFLHEQVCHLHWMCTEARRFVDDGKLDKAFRWLGFIQGSFWALKMRTIAESKMDNKPIDERFDKEHI